MTGACPNHSPVKITCVMSPGVFVSCLYKSTISYFSQSNFDLLLKSVPPEFPFLRQQTNSFSYLQPSAFLGWHSQPNLSTTELLIFPQICFSSSLAHLISPSSTQLLKPNTPELSSIFVLSSASATTLPGNLVKSYDSCSESGRSTQLLLPPQSKPPPSLASAVETAIQVLSHLSL